MNKEKLEKDCKKKLKKDWFKPKGYLHFTRQVNYNDRKAIDRLVKNSKYVARHAFYPLLFYEIVTRRRNKGLKKRPIAYATHLDAQIYSYYAQKLAELYETKLKEQPKLNEAVIAYRKILKENCEENCVGKCVGKCNIDFAYDAFDTIKKWDDCIVLTFDIKNFYSTIDHILLKKAWINLLNKSKLPECDYNIYRAVTKFSYVKKKDLKTHNNGFDEQYLAQLRKKGIKAFFESGADFRKKVVENPNIRIYKNTCKNGRRFVGIPQGLPISPVLANLYMYDFDKKFVEEFVEKGLCNYWRYSDDILVVCRGSKLANKIEKRIRELLKKHTRLQLSNAKTERFECRIENGKQTIEQIVETGRKGKPYLSYLGFDYYGDKTLVKSATLAKYYRRMKTATRNKVRRMQKTRLKHLLPNPVLYKRKLYRKFTYTKRGAKRYKRPFYIWRKVATDYYIPERKFREKRNWGNSISYVKKAAEIMQEKRIERQMRKHKRNFEAYLKKQLEKYGFV